MDTKNLMNDRSLRKKDFICIGYCLVIIGAFIVTAMISFLSEYGIHPDEYDVKLCMDWCMDRWIWPDMRLTGAGLGNTYSGYGYTKVCNYTPYFLIFSKIAFVFQKIMGNLPYYRMPNLLLMAVMCVYILKKLKTQNWLMLGFGICIQAWYIFSYVTADAEDFFLAFFAIVMLGDEDSLLWKTLNSQPDKPVRGRDLVCCIALGVMYGVLMLGKPYYYAIHAFTFTVLIIHLVKSKINYRKSLLSKYLLIAGIAIAIFAGRTAIEIHYYGFDKMEVKEQMMEQYCDYDKNPRTPPEEQAQTWRMVSKGYSLPDLFRLDPKWFEKTFRSYASYSVYNDGHVLFYIAMAALYGIIYVWMGISLCRNGDKWTFIIVSLFISGSLAASVLFSYLWDDQPQGRYVLTIGLFACYLGSRTRTLWQNRIFRGVVLSAACLSILYYGLFVSRKVIDLGYVRELLRL